MSDRDSFGPRLRAARERRGISLETIASVTNVSADLWEGLERNDVSRWPGGIFARSFVRDYARAIGLDEAEVVDEFCRLFPVGDRRTRRIIEAHARIVGHEAAIVSEAGGVLLLAAGTSLLFRTGFYETAGVLALLYYGIATMTLGSSAGTLIVAALRQRMPSLFGAPDRRRAHA